MPMNANYTPTMVEQLNEWADTLQLSVSGVPLEQYARIIGVVGGIRHVATDLAQPCEVTQEENHDRLVDAIRYELDRNGLHAPSIIASVVATLLEDATAPAVRKMAPLFRQVEDAAGLRATTLNAEGGE